MEGLIAAILVLAEVSSKHDQHVIVSLFLEYLKMVEANYGPEIKACIRHEE